MEACTRGLGRGYGKKQEILDSSRNLHTKQRTGSTRKKSSTAKKQEIRESSRNPHLKQKTRKRKVRKKSKKKEIYPYVSPQSKTSIEERTEKKKELNTNNFLIVSATAPQQYAFIVLRTT